MEISTLSPEDLGLPEKFGEFRPVQVDALERIAESDKNIILLQAPTGSGKTLIMAAMGKYLGTQVLYTCHTKQLQGQVVGDFPYAVELKGRANYHCLKGGYTCDECTNERGSKSKRLCEDCTYRFCGFKMRGEEVDNCPCQSRCPYRLQKRRAKEADLAMLNMAYFLNEFNFAGDFSGWSWVVLDEGDLTENALMSFIEVTITAARIEQLRIAPPKKKTVAEAWFEWAEDDAIPAIEHRLSELEDTVFALDIKEKKDLERLLSKLRFFTRQNLNSWAFIPSEAAWTFKPVFISRYAEYNLWKHGQRFLVMSATIVSPKQFARDLGLDEGDIEFIDLPCTFPIERRPVHFAPVADMTHKSKETAWPLAVRALDRILDEHPYEKGLVHTVSYPLARYVFDNSRHKGRLLQHDPIHRISALERFKTEDQPLVLISPSMDRGVDLPNDLCRFLVLLKIPYPNLGDQQISRRLYSARDGPIWYAVQTIRTIVQSTGRGMRSEDDWCVGYIVDEQFRRLYSQYADMFPRWWRDALEPCPPFLVALSSSRERHWGEL
ncbi:MAG: DEAD/DEAH box helicase family protein [Desulfobacterales bacterium]|nr:DEAD/DEAH box helicase family protein [Desulfobacterales bacterium]